MEEIKGQYSIFGADSKAKGVHYNFNRYIGQKVRDSHGEHIIKEIEKYYTIYEDGMVGTPHDLTPVDHDERMEYLRNAFNSQLRLAKETTDSGQKNIHLANLRKLIKALKEEEKRGKKMRKDEYALVDEVVRYGKYKLLTQMEIEIDQIFNDEPWEYHDEQRTALLNKVKELIQKKINELEAEADSK